MTRYLAITLMLLTPALLAMGCGGGGDGAGGDDSHHFSEQYRRFVIAELEHQQQRQQEGDLYKGHGLGLFLVGAAELDVDAWIEILRGQPLPYLAHDQFVEDQLVNRHEIAAKRIIDCNPSIDSNAKAKPRAALEI